LGNVQQGLTATLTLPSGTYYWSVQAIDTAFAGSTFAPEASFTVPPLNLLALTTMVSPTTALPGQTLTYTLAFTNVGLDLAGEVVLSNVLPLSLTVQTIHSSGATITPTWAIPPTYIWQVQDLAPGQSGVLTLTAVSDPVAVGIFTNTTTITSATVETNTTNNRAAASLSLPLFSLDPVASAELSDVSGTSTDWGDYDGDGDLDLLVAGYSGPISFIAKLYQNTGSGLVEVEPTLSDAASGNAAWGDYDNDGKLDILLPEKDEDQKPIIKVYRNTGSGFVDAGVELPGVAEGGNVAWADYNNDGFLDFSLSGYNYDQNQQPWAQLPLAKIYRNTANGFVDAGANLPDVAFSSAGWGDYDRDGDLDLLANVALYQNTVSNFVDAGLNLSGTEPSSTGWGDYNNDGYLDFFLAKEGGPDWPSAATAKVYRNTGHDFLETSLDLPSGLWSSHGMTWIDYDNDGDLDLLLGGWSEDSDGNQYSLVKVYRNTDGDFVDAGADLVGAGVAPLVCADYDNDGDLDLFAHNEVYRNNVGRPNTPPNAPGGLSSRVNGSRIELRWTAAADAQTPAAGLSYNLRVGTAPGRTDVLSPMACVENCGQSGDGYRQVVDLGNAQQGLTATLTLPAGTYYWSVQAIDTALAGSPFSPEASFTVPPS
jgi:uncharacterized repeat protein (TIGR01451 family)